MIRLSRSSIRVLSVVMLTGWAVAIVGGASPNGSRIAFEGDRNGGWGLSVMKPDGSAVSDLLAPFGAADASWAPNGQQVAFEADPNGDGNTEVFVMDADGSNLVQLTDSPAPDLWPDWFPDGRRIAFTSVRDGAPNIYVMNADGSDQYAVTDITDLEIGSLQPDVSPTARQIVFMRGGEFEQPAIWRIDVDGTNLVALTAPGPRNLDPQWSPNG